MHVQTPEVEKEEEGEGEGGSEGASRCSQVDWCQLVLVFFWSSAVCAGQDLSSRDVGGWGR